MLYHQPSEVIGFHSCDKSTGINVLNGKIDLKPSENSWDWLGNGIYFWEQNPDRALQYAQDSSQGKQFNRIKIKTPFVLGAIIETGNCLNLMEPESFQILSQAYNDLQKIYNQLDKKVPVNKGDKRELDCAIFKLIHQSNVDNKRKQYDSIRSAFSEGLEVYPTANFTSKGHIQICVINSDCIKGYFLPKPIKKYNPYLDI